MSSHTFDCTSYTGRVILVRDIINLSILDFFYTLYYYYAGQSSGDTLNPVYSSEVTSNPSFLNNGGIYQEPDCNINEASKACELYEPSGDHEYDYAKVEAENNKPAAPADDLEYDYAKSDEIKSAVNRLPVKYNHYHNPNVNNQNASTNAREKKETGEKENDAGSLYQVLENDTGPVYQTLDEE